MSTSKRQLPAIMFLVAGVLFLFAAFIPRSEPANRFLVIIGVILLVLALVTFRQGLVRSSADE